MKKILILILVCFSSVSADNIEDEVKDQATYNYLLKCSHEDLNLCKKDYQNFLVWFKQKDQIVYDFPYYRLFPYHRLFGCDRNYLLDFKKDIEKAIRLTFLKQAKLYDIKDKDHSPDISIWMTCNKFYNLGNRKLIAGRITLEFQSIRNYLITRRDVNLSYFDKWRGIEDEEIYLIFGNDTSELKRAIEDSITYFNYIITNTAKAINQ
ncbi:hypothetical protein HpCK101_09020 [Helicobacter pylori]